MKVVCGAERRPVCGDKGKIGRGLTIHPPHLEDEMSHRIVSPGRFGRNAQAGASTIVDAMACRTFDRPRRGGLGLGLDPGRIEVRPGSPSHLGLSEWRLAGAADLRVGG